MLKKNLLKIIELLKAPKAYNNIPFVLGMLETLVSTIDGGKSDDESTVKKKKYILF